MAHARIWWCIATEHECLAKNDFLYEKVFFVYVVWGMCSTEKVFLPPTQEPWA